MMERTDNIVLVDVDGPVADLHTTWLDRINRQHGCSVKVSDLKTWNIVEHLPQEAVAGYLSHLHCSDLYDDVLPVKGALQGIRKLRELGYRVVFASSSTPASAQAKMLWLERHGFSIDHTEAHVGDFVSIHHKDWLLPNNVLVDDGPHNVVNRWKAVVWDMPYNRPARGVRDAYYKPRAKNWTRVVREVQRLQPLWLKR